MIQKVRVALAAILLTLALLGTSWVASAVQPVQAEGLPGENGG